MTQNEQWNGQFRHLLTIISGFLITKGMMSEADAGFWSEMAWILPGVVLGGIGLVKSWKSKKNDEKVADLVEQVASRVIERIEGKAKTDV